MGRFLLIPYDYAGIVCTKGEYLIEINSGGMLTWLIVMKLIVPATKKTVKDTESAASV